MVFCSLYKAFCTKVPGHNSHNSVLTCISALAGSEKGSPWNTSAGLHPVATWVGEEG